VVAVSIYSRTSSLGPLAFDLGRFLDLHAFELLDDVVDLAVEVVDELARLLCRDRALAGGLDEVLLLEDPQRVADLVVRVARLVGHLHDPDGFVLDHHPQNLQMTFQHVDFLLEPVYHGNC